MLDLAGLVLDLQEILGTHVDVLTPGALGEGTRDQIMAEAVPL